MFYHLLQHPGIAELYHNSSAIGRKEIRFFDRTVAVYRPDIKFYLANFPRFNQDIHNEETLSGEATPNYLHHSHAAQRIKDMFPDMKLVVMLRNPIDRAYSHFNHALTIENKLTLPYSGGNTFETLIEAEMKMLKVCEQHLMRSWADLMQCVQPLMANMTRELQIPKIGKSGGMVWLLQMISRGLYAPQLQNYLQHFKANQIMVVQSEEFYKDTVQVLRRVEKFLGLKQYPGWDKDSDEVKKIFNFGVKNTVYERGAAGMAYASGSMSLETHKALSAFFRPFNDRLRDMFENAQTFKTWDN